ncbi:MAG: hypothetical protein RL318_946 [Fibrobacterota bacterium]|jgi:hypothetical protein
MKQRKLAYLALGLVAGLTGCARGLAENYSSMGFRGQKVVFVADQADVVVKTTSEALKNKPYLRMGENVQSAFRALVRDSLAAWGTDCGAQFFPKEGSYSLRMGLMHAADGWNVADPNVLKNYARANNTDYLVVVNKIEVKRLDVRAADGAPIVGTDLVLDLSVIDARQGTRVARESITGHSESAESLDLLVPKAMGLAVDNFFVGVPEARRWGCRGLADRFQ